MSLLRDTGIEIDNPHSVEEDEFAEEQKRRQEELSDLLTNGFTAFHYDDSTMNSSTTSVEDPEQNHRILTAVEKFKYVPDDTGKSNISDSVQNYKDAKIQDQLKVLYEVRVREINNLREEFNTYKNEKAKEIAVLKNKSTLAEADIRHMQISLSNSESLLVEKAETINQLKQNLSSRDQETEHLKKLIEDMKVEICTYKSMVNELQLKQVDFNPLNATSRRIQSEELQKAHHDQVLKLESLLQEESKRSTILEKQNARLEEDIKKLIKSKTEIEEENNLTVVALSKKLQSSQQQCKDLFLLGEALKKESDHFKERMQQLEINKLDVSGGGYNIKQMDKDTMLVHMEKLKRMLLDKDIEMNTLKSKLKFYNSDLSELFEYRRILSEMSSAEIKHCNNPEHDELLIFMQRQLQSYEQAIEDRNNQIIALTKDKTELQEQIQQGIQQTRTELENLSQKYSLPQLETMSNELKNAEETINELKNQLVEKQELIHKLNGDSLKDELKQTKDANNKMQQLLEDYKKLELQLIQENARVKSDLQTICAKLGISENDVHELDHDIHEIDSLKTKYEQVRSQLQQIIIYLEQTNVKRTNLGIIYKLKEQIVYDLEHEKPEISGKLEAWKRLLDEFFDSQKVEQQETLEYQLQCRNIDLEQAHNEIKLLNDAKNSLLNEIEANGHVINKLNEQLNNLNKYLQVVEENKEELEKQLDFIKKQTSQTEFEGGVRKKLHENEHTLGNGKTFHKSLQAEVLKAELALRDKLQEEYIEKMQKIEEQYTKALVEKCELYNKEKEKSKRQEAVYRQQFAAVLEECGRKMEELEKENIDLIKQTDALVKEYKTYRNETERNMMKYQKMIVESKRNAETLNRKWADILEYYMAHVSNIEKHSQKGMKQISKKLSASQNEVNLIESMYNIKIEQCKSEMEKVLKTT